jgi:hypothetical protein
METKKYMHIFIRNLNTSQSMKDYKHISKVGLYMVFLNEILGGEWYWYKLQDSIDIDKFFKFA